MSDGSELRWGQASTSTAQLAFGNRVYARGVYPRAIPAGQPSLGVDFNMGARRAFGSGYLRNGDRS